MDTSEYQIRPLVLPEDLSAFKNIFFLTSTRKNFSSEKEKELFFEKWTSYYTRVCWKELFGVYSLKTSELVGYLTGCSNSASAKTHLKEQNATYLLFESEFKRFPAHLHINIHPDHQGKNLGRALMDSFKKILVHQRISGLHIVTDPRARNVSFYQRNGFLYQIEKSHQERSYLLMGCNLDPLN